jgi:hypothetical protein
MQGGSEVSYSCQQIGLSRVVVRWGTHEPITRHQVPTLWRRHNLVFKWWICHLRRHMGLGFGIHDHAHESIMGIQGIKMFYRCYIFRYITFDVNGTFENLIASRYNIKSYEQGSETNPKYIYIYIYICPTWIFALWYVYIYIYVSFQVPMGMHFRIHMKCGN